ncbi:hypothetical protein M0802_014619 [Mischocyttarus mexicanus]|nr:hypothetical protein M0802_014619 [Mischocyttarus mexicanus]
MCLCLSESPIRKKANKRSISCSSANMVLRGWSQVGKRESTPFAAVRLGFRGAAFYLAQRPHLPPPSIGEILSLSSHFFFLSLLNLPGSYSESYAITAGPSSS